MMTRMAVPRRTFLRGVGAAVALPFLDAMVPAFAAPNAGKPPVRMAFVYVPNGIDMRNWNPSYEGKLQELPRILKPLEPFKEDITILGNLTHNAGRALLDGAGDHGRCCAAYLTGVQPRKTMVDIKSGISFDQIVANQVGRNTRFPSLEVGMEDARQAGDCDSGYSCAYTNNLSWRSETQPLPPTLNPRLLFERLFGTGTATTPEARARQNKYRRSILDFVTDDTKKLESDLGPSDRRKLDEYLSSIREIEHQIERAEKDNAQLSPGMDKPYGIPADFRRAFPPDDQHDHGCFPGGSDPGCELYDHPRGNFPCVSGNRNSRRSPPADSPSESSTVDGESGADQYLPYAPVCRLD